MAENWQAFQATSLTAIDIDSLDAGVEYEIEVRAVSSDGVASDWTDSVFFVTPTDVTPPSTPSTPIVASKLGGFTIEWDGKTASGGTMEPDFQRLDVLANGTVIASFAAPSAAATSWTDCAYGTDYTFTFIAYDTSGNASAASAGVTQKVTPLVDTDIIGKIIDGSNVKDGSITPAQVSFTARDIGGVTTTTSSTAPASPELGDLWIDTASGNLLRRWNGTTWESFRDATIATAQATADAASSAADVAQSTADGKNRVFSQNDPPTATAIGDIWFDADDHFHMYRWNGNSWADAMQATMAYSQSRGSDLVTNGTGFLGNNTNFSQLTYLPTDAPTGAVGSFLSQPGYLMRVCDELIPINTDKKLKFSFYCKQIAKDATGNPITDGRFYGLLEPFDSYGNAIQPYSYYFAAGSTTTLAADVNPGDTTITLTDASGWDVSTVTSRHGVIFWDYVDQGGKAWPVETYSRNYLAAPAYNETGVSGNVITLRSPYVGPVHKAGTAVSNGWSGGSYLYSPVGAVVPTDWQQFTGLISGIVPPSTLATFDTGWPPGTAQAKVGWLCNYTSGNQASQMAVAGVSLSDATAAQDMAAAAQIAANGKNRVFRSSATPISNASYTLTSGDTWFDTSNGNRVSVYDGSSWVVSQLQGLAVGNLDAGSITTGYLSADRLAAGVITSDKIAAKTITAGNIAASTITAAQIAADTITAAQIAASAITATELAANAVTAGKIQAGAIDASKIAADTITAAQIATGAITASELAAGAVTADKILAGAVITEKIAALAVTADQIAANAITADKISAGAIDGMTISGLTITAVNSLAIGNRTAFNDAIQGWWFTNDGYANTNDSAGNTFLTVNPRSGSQYIQIGSDTGNHLKYTSSTGLLELNGTFKTTPSATNPGSLVISGELSTDQYAYLFGDYEVGMLFDLGDDTGASIRSRTAQTATYTGPTGVIGMYTKADTDFLELGGGFTLHGGGAGVIELSTDPTAGDTLDVNAYRTTFATYPGNTPVDSTDQFHVVSSNIGLENYAASSGAGMWIQDDGSTTGVITFGGILWSQDTYNNVLPGGVPMYIGAAGQIFRQSSATRYKVAIEPLETKDEILSLQPKIWYDRNASEKYAELYEQANGDTEKFARLVEEARAADPFLLTPGLVAEDVEAVGLDKFVIRNDNGEIENLMYDRLWITLIPIIKKQGARIAALEAQLSKESA